MTQNPEISNSAVEPAPRDAEWLKRHEAFVSRARAGGVDVLFLGDSLTDWWRDPARGGPVWEKYFANMNAANFGISADRTQHVLWRLEHGEATGYSPKVIVLLIGTNNTGMENDGRLPRNTPEETILGVGAVVAELRARFSNARILLHAIFPRDVKESLQRRQIIQINKSLSKLGDHRHVFWLDIGWRFLDGEGHIREDLMPDLLHLNTNGYQVWAEAIEEIVRNLLNKSVAVGT